MSNRDEVERFLRAMREANLPPEAEMTLCLSHVCRMLAAAGADKATLMEFVSGIYDDAMTVAAIGVPKGQA